MYVCVCVLVVCLVSGVVCRSNRNVGCGMFDLWLVCFSSCASLLLEGRGWIQEDFCQSQLRNRPCCPPCIQCVHTVSVCVCVTFLIITRHCCDKNGVYWSHISNVLQLKWCVTKLVCVCVCIGSSIYESPLGLCVTVAHTYRSLLIILASPRWQTERLCYALKHITTNAQIGVALQTRQDLWTYRHKTDSSHVTPS